MSLRNKRVFSRFNFTVPAVLLCGFLTVFAVSTRVFSSNETQSSEQSLAAAPTPASRNFATTVDGRRVIALYAPVVRSKSKVDIGIDIEFTNGGSITARAAHRR